MTFKSRSFARYANLSFGGRKEKGEEEEEEGEGERKGKRRIISLERDRFLPLSEGMTTTGATGDHDRWDISG